MFSRQWTWWRMYSFFTLWLVAIAVVGIIALLWTILPGNSAAANAIVRLSVWVGLISAIGPIVIALFVIAACHRDGDTDEVLPKHIGQALLMALLMVAVAVVLNKVGDIIGIRRIPLAIFCVHVYYVWTQPILSHRYAKASMALKMWKHSEPC